MLLIVLLSGCCIMHVGCKETAPRTTEDGSAWEAVIEAGFGSTENYGVVAMAEYRGQLYAMTRNETQGAEIWRTNDAGGWEQVLYPGGEQNGIYGNPWIDCMWGAMAVFQNRLYCGFSSGHQGKVYDSTGCEIWRYDGSGWEPVISDKRDTEESGTITTISGCVSDDGDTTARITDSSKHWEPDHWAGGVLQITSGEGAFRRFDIVGNTGDTLTVQQNEQAGNLGQEHTVCEAQHFKNPYPPFVEYDRGGIAAGDSYSIGTGWDENGFGNYWNKMIPSMVIFNNTLYVSTALNNDYGAQVWCTKDGDTWSVTEPAYSLGNFHSDEDYRDGNRPISTSIPCLCVSSVSGEPVLYAGGTGAAGNKGKCARMARLTDTGWELIVDGDVDDNDSGSNENGFGCGMDCSMWNGNYMPWSMAESSGRLYVGIQTLAGARVLYTDNASPEDGSWHYSAGGDSGILNGFDGVQNRGKWFLSMYQNIAANLFSFDGELYAGLVSNFAPKLGMDERYLTGAQLWRTADGTAWVPVTLSGFGDSRAVSVSSFVQHDGALYVGIAKASGDGPEGLEPPEGGMIYRLVSQPGVPEPAYDSAQSYEATMPESADPVDVYYPDTISPDNDTQRRFPVALLLQGAYCDKSIYSAYASAVARYGFIVAVPNHFRSYEVYGYPMEGLFSEQQQLYEVLSFMAGENDDPGSPVSGRVDTSRLVLLGHSFGAACGIMAIQNTCMPPFCEGGYFTRPEELKAAALSGIKTPLGGAVPTGNLGLPLAIVNGALDSNATYDETKRTYEGIADTPKALVFIKGANHYGLCNENNPSGPSPDENEPAISQEQSIETAARWSALFLQAHALDDGDAWNYIYNTGKYLDSGVEVFSDPEQ